MKTLILTIFTIFLLSGIAYAQQQQQGQGRSGRRSPPQEAIDACSGLQENASCSFQIEVEGTCFAPPQGTPDGASLACAPQNHRRGGGGGKGGGGRGQGGGQGGRQGPGQGQQ